MGSGELVPLALKLMVLLAVEVLELLPDLLGVPLALAETVLVPLWVKPRVVVGDPVPVKEGVGVLVLDGAFAVLVVEAVAVRELVTLRELLPLVEVDAEPGIVGVVELVLLGDEVLLAVREAGGTAPWDWV